MNMQKARKMIATTLFPSEFIDALMASMQWPDSMRHARIDQITDQLVSRGICRPRTCDKRAAEWAVQREIGAAAAEGRA